MIFLLCVNVYPAKPPLPVPPWGNKSHRVITRCKVRMSLLFIAALKQRVSGLLLSDLEEICFPEPFMLTLDTASSSGRCCEWQEQNRE